MNSSQLIEKIKNDGKIENEIFEDDIYLDLEGINLINQYSILLGVIFINCKFKQRFNLTNLKFETINPVTFNKCTFKNEAVFVDFHLKALNFKDCTFESNVLLENITCDSSELSLVENHFGGVFTLNNIRCNSLFLSENFIQFCDVNNVKSNFIHFVNSHITKEISELNFGKNPDVENIKIESDCKIHSIKLNDAKNTTLIGRFDKISIESAKFTSISFDGTTIKDSKSGMIENIQFINRNFEGNIDFNNLWIHNLKFINLKSNTGAFTFNNVELESCNLSNVKVNKIYFDLVKFKSILKIENCDLVGLRPNNVRWLKNNVLTPDLTLSRKKLKKTNTEFTELDKYVTELKYQRDVFRQLKIASQNNHNQVEALIFYRNEMRLYWKEIRLTRGVSKSNRFLVFLNRLMSDFGQNYWLPLMWIAIFQTLFSVLIWNFEACKHCVEGTTCVNNFWSGLSQYLNWINPIFKAPENWSDGAKITSFFMRIFNGFFIFHFVKAIRKYGK